MKTKLFYIYKSSFFRFCVNYLFMLTITICIGSYAYYHTLNMVKSDEIESGIKALEQSKNLLDTRFNEIESMVKQLALDHKVLNLLYIQKPLTGSEYYKIQELSQKMPSYKNTNEFIYDAYIYFNTDIFVSSSFATAEMEKHYNKMFRYKDVDYSEWKDKVVNGYKHSSYWPANIVQISNNQQSVITHIQSIPMGAYSNYRASIIMLINESEVLKGLGGINVINNGWFYIEDKDGNIITSLNRESNVADLVKFDDNSKSGYVEKVISGEKILVLYSTSTNNGWRYVQGIPISYLTQKVNYIKKIYTTTLLIVLIIGFLIAILFSYKNSKPIQTLTKQLINISTNIRDDKESDFDFINNTVSKIIENNDKLQADIKKQIEMSKAVFLERLLKGNFNKTGEIKTIQSYLGLELSGDRLVSIVIQINHYYSEISNEVLNELDITRAFIGNEIKKLIKYSNYIYNIDNDKIAIIVGFDGKDTNNLNEYLKTNIEQLLENITRSYDIVLSVGIGGEYEKLENIRISYEEAIKAIQFMEGQNRHGILFYNNVYKEFDEYYYPLDLEGKLISLIKMGEEKEAYDVFETIYSQNISKTWLSIKKVKLLASEIIGTIFKLKQSMNEQNNNTDKMNVLIKKIEEADNLEEIFVNMKSILNILCEDANKQKRSHNVSLKENIINYINKEFHSDNLCLLSIASNFRISDKYLSNFFKEQVGENVQAYIERIRMEKAIKYLEEGNINVNDVANKIGYNNVNTFYKAFKRVHGVSPTLYRKNSNYDK